MQGDFSRQTFDPRKHYRKVNAQMGRVGADADPNEQSAIEEFVLDTETMDVIGVCGAPKAENGGGFQIGVSADGSDLTISPGRIYVDGVLCINDQDASTPATLTSQPDLPLAKAGLAGFSMPTDPGIYLAYLDVWQRHITAVEDPEIREVALGGPDTSTRAKTVWQVKVVKVAESGAAIDCSTLPANWKPAPPDGELSAQSAAPVTDAGPCILPPTAGYRSLQNQLYRVEVHTGGPRASATFKWSRDNGSITTAIVAAPNGQTLTVQNTGPDDVLGFARDQWVEVLDDRMELIDGHGTLVQVDSVSPATREITIKAATPIPALDLTAHPKLRRWDQSGVSATAAGVPMAAGWLAIEDGLEVQFSDKTYQAASWWWIPARTAINGAAGNIEWRVDSSGQPLPEPPDGIEHAYCALGLVSFDGSVFAAPVTDCRPLFPPLTAITAADVSYDNSVCKLPGVTNVQEALDAMCHGCQGMCTVLVAPGPNWEAAFEGIADGQDAEICFQVGEYTIEKPIVLKGKGNLTIQGCGPGTKILGPKVETAFTFVECTGVVVRDVAITTGIAAAGAGSPNQHLNGSLTFQDCPFVTVNSVRIECAAGSSRNAACLTVSYVARNTGSIASPLPTSVRVRHCDFFIGYQQAGMLLLNVQRAHIEDNQLQVVARPSGLGLSTLVQNDDFRAAARRLLVSHNYIGQKAPAGQTPPTNTALSLNNQRIQIRTNTALAQPWQHLVTELAPQAAQTPIAVSSFVKQTADRLLLEPELRQVAPAFQDWFNLVDAQLPSVAAQGIVVGGILAGDVRILNNTITGVLQGIHVGLSHREASKGAPDQSGPVRIAGNTIQVLFVPAATRGRHGIFVGNCGTLVLDNNTISVIQPSAFAARQPIDGIRVWGALGRVMLVRQNEIQGASTGIHVQPVGAPPRQKNQWQVSDNMIEGAQNPVVAPGDGSVIQSNNFS